MLDRGQLANLLAQEYGLELRGADQPIYRTLYPEVINQVEFPKGYKVPDFVTFSGEGNQSTVEHIGRFTVQCGEANMEKLFLNQFYRTEIEPTLADFSRLSQLPFESAKTFIARFRRARLRCHVPLPEQEYIRLALNDLDFELRKRFEGVTFCDVYDLAEKATRYELVLKKEKERKNSSKDTYYRNPNYEVFLINLVDEEDLDANLAKIIIKKPYVYEALTKPKASTSADKQIILPKGHNIPSDTESKGKEFYKFHNSWNHTTNNCYVFRNVLQKAIDEGVLKFPEKKPDVMGVDDDPFLNIVNTNVISLSLEKAADNGKQERSLKILDSSSSASNDE
ncbi:uncharacterized protein LOC132268978 [Cornus florida]|uniref:uncharacterized protein LOC132268978 n=1 Tax=Cornus florida TaxID=4283 RepID=UPI0028994D06|nr:uncharacterized protein LOC132268978 [Cornus florida]